MTLHTYYCLWMPYSSKLSTTLVFSVKYKLVIVTWLKIIVDMSYETILGTTVTEKYNSVCTFVSQG